MTNRPSTLPLPKLQDFWPLPDGARVMSVSPSAVTIRYKGSSRTRCIGVQTDLGQSAEWNRARNAVACDARDRILAAVESGAIVLGQPIFEPDSYPDEDPAEYSDELCFFC